MTDDFTASFLLSVSTGIKATGNMLVKWTPSEVTNLPTMMKPVSLESCNCIKVKFGEVLGLAVTLLL